MKEKLKGREKEAALQSVYGKKQIVMFADAYHDLARSFSDNKNIPQSRYPDRREYLYKKQLYDAREILSQRMHEMANRMNALAAERLTYKVPSKNLQKQLRAALKKHGVVLNDITYSEQEGLCCYVIMSGLRNADYTTEDVADVLSEMFKTPLVSAKENLFFVAYEEDCYRFEERPLYSLECGVAKATKENESVSGDNYSFYEVNTAKTLSILSDGAGSGTEACEDSELVLEWMEKYLDAGFRVLEATGIVNGILLAEGRELNMPTLDVCEVDLYNNTACFIKYGTADSYIFRKDQIFKIRNYGFPLGFCDEKENIVTEEGTRYYLEEGDFILMLSDGVPDALNDEETLLKILGMKPFSNATELANHILSSVVRISGGHIRDDMTVIVMQIRISDVR